MSEGRIWTEESLGIRTKHVRMDQAASTKASVMATACPYCLTMLGDRIKEKGMENYITVFDLAELLEEALLLRGAYNCLHPPFRKGGMGGFETWKIPLNPNSVALNKIMPYNPS